MSFTFYNGVNIQLFITSVDSLLFTTENLNNSVLSFRHLSRTILTDDRSVREEYGKVNVLVFQRIFIGLVHANE